MLDKTTMRSQKQIGDIGNSDGDIVVVAGDDPVFQSTGFVSVSEAQAQHAIRFGWRLFGRNFMRPGFITVARERMFAPMEVNDELG